MPDGLLAEKENPLVLSQVVKGSLANAAKIRIHSYQLVYVYTNV